MITYLAGLVALSIALVASGLSARRQLGGRWGEERIAIRALGDGAYRSAPIHTTRARLAPRRVTFAAILTRVWAALTAFAFAPAGVLALLPSWLLPTRHAEQWVLVGGTIGVVVSGLALSAALARAAKKLEQRDSSGLDRTLCWSLAHHAAVALITITAHACIHRAPMAAVVTMAISMCLVGGAITALLAYASVQGSASS